MANIKNVWVLKSWQYDLNDQPVIQTINTSLKAIRHEVDYLDDAAFDRLVNGDKVYYKPFGEDLFLYKTDSDDDEVIEWLELMDERSRE